MFLPLLIAFGLQGPSPVVRTPNVCVSALASEDPAWALLVVETAQALRARLATPDLTIAACDAMTHAGATWRVTLSRDVSGALQLALEGAGVEPGPAINVEGETDSERAHHAALRVTERLRPTVDAALLGREASQTPANASVAALERLVQEERVVAPPVAPQAPQTPYTAFLRVGSGLVVGPGGVGVGQIELSGGWRAPRIWVAGSTALRSLRRYSRGEVSWQGAEAVVAVASGSRWREVDVGVELLARNLAMRLESGTALARRDRWTFWDGGAGLAVAWDAFELRGARVALLGHLAVWPQPRRLSINGAPLLAQTPWDVGLAVAVGF
ncbi:MAG: hypothetical protein AAB426_15020 [Myxococcota bacterium]